ncbi:MAG: peptidoglycan-binding domain-containing protein [Stagnimonas sp.]|nr:peptidoglycan-binding domain-containing protein [Stagnimonas sp.]
MGYRLSALSLLALLLPACASTPTGPSRPADQAASTQLVDRLQAEAEPAYQTSPAASVAMPPRSRPAPAPAQAPAAPASSGEAAPINARTGECYARVVTPPRFESRSEQVLARAATERVEVIPARFEYVDETVMVKPASKKIVEIIPAVFRTVEERVLVKTASEQIEQIPASYRIVEERQLVKPATTMWTKGRGPIEKLDQLSGEIMCLVEVPAEYRVVRTQVIDTEAQVRRTPIPSEYRTVLRQELVKPAEVREIDLPAEYKTIQVLRLVAPAEERRIPVPAEYQSIERQVLLSAGTASWKSILCETNTTPGIVADIQRALLAKGFNPGKIDGVLGRDTAEAIRAFQQATGLATGGLTLETLERLGVDRT